MIEFTRNMFIYQLEQDTVKDSNCTIRVFDKEYNLLKTKAIPINILSEFLLAITYK